MMNTRAYLQGYLTKQAGDADTWHEVNPKTQVSETKYKQGLIDKAKAEQAKDNAASESPLPPAVQAAPVTAAPGTKLPVKK
jgi:hypothetical protein